MAATYRSVSTIVYDSDGGSVASSAPSGVVSGDQLLMGVFCNSTGTVTTPSGWDLKATQEVWFSTTKLHCFARVADGGANDTPTVSCPAVATSIVMVRADGQHASTPFDINATTEDGDNPATAPDRTSANADSLAVYFWMSGIGYAGTISVDNGFTLRASPGSGGGVAVATKAVGAGSVGATDLSSTSTLIRSGIWQVILKPTVSASVPVQDNAQLHLSKSPVIDEFNHLKVRADINTGGWRVP